VRISIKALVVSMTLAICGMLAFTATPALANAPAPHCDSGARSFDCSANYVPGLTFNWTINWSEYGTPFSYGQSISSAYDFTNQCDAGWIYYVTYSYTSGGTTVNSDTGSFQCNPNAWP
jgi:hypothetical protein